MRRNAQSNSKGSGYYYEPTEELRGLVAMCVVCGNTRVMIAEAMGVSEKTLLEHYRWELEHADMMAHAQVAKQLYTQCMNGNVRAMEFWLMTKGRWKRDISIEVKGTFGDSLRAALGQNADVIDPLDSEPGSNVVSTQ